MAILKVFLKFTHEIPVCPGPLFGLIEPCIKILKYYIQHTGEGDCLTFAELVTVLAGTVNITNDQPLEAKL